MKSIPMMRLGLLLAACTLAIPGMPADYQLEAITIAANAPLEVHISADEAVNNPVYLDAQGQWKALKVDKSAQGISFAFPNDAMGSTVMLLNKPAWLTLPDTDVPAVDAASCGGTPLEVAPDINLGHLEQAPRNLFVTVSDATNPLAAGRVAVTINGRSATDLGGSLKIDQSKDGKHADIILTLPDLPRDKYEIRITVTDASPRANATTLSLTFNTAPLLKNADFEQVADNGVPVSWSAGAWDEAAETKYETKAVDGGRSGKALMIHGIARPLNLIVGQAVDLVPGETYVLSGYYKNEGNFGHASLIAGGKKIQYDNMAGLPKADNWTPFSWEVTAAPEGKTWTLYLRSTGIGKVYFDDLNLAPKQ